MWNGKKTQQAKSQEWMVAQQEEDARMAASENTTEGSVIGFVGPGVEFKGVIRYNGTVRIDGRMDGEIHTDGVLVVGKDAVLTAQIHARMVVSRGKITGDITATEKVKLLAPAAFKGPVITPLLSMEEGVLFNGTLDMPQDEQSAAIRPAPQAFSTSLRLPFDRAPSAEPVEHGNPVRAWKPTRKAEGLEKGR